MNTAEKPVKAASQSTERDGERPVPTYRRHRQSGQGIVTLTDGLGGRKDVLLGKYGTRDSRTRYAQVIQEWESSGRRLPGPAPADLTVTELILRYWTFAKGYYRKNGKPTEQQHRIRMVLSVLKGMYGHSPAAQFGPKSLKAVRDRMITLPCGLCKGTGQLQEPRRKDDRRSGNTGTTCSRCQGRGQRGWARRTINTAVGCIKRLFKWSVAEELVPAAVFHGLLAVDGLRKGRTEARETKPIRPVEDKHVEAILPYLTKVVRAMVQVQQLTGMRPGEVCILRPCDVDRSGGQTWLYRPESHKTEHHDLARVVIIGPRAQAVLAPFLLRDANAYCFSPREAVAEVRARLHEQRKTPVQPSQRDRSKRCPERQPGEHYKVDAYGNAIERACIKAGIPAWNPNQLRHSLATEIRRVADLDTARAILGHQSVVVTQVYAERDEQKAREVMERLG
jgi:integrase